MDLNSTTAINLITCQLKYASMLSITAILWPLSDTVAQSCASFSLKENCSYVLRVCPSPISNDSIWGS